MYSLNINFLKDRPEFQTGKQAADKKKGGGSSAQGGQLPLVLGAIVGLALPAAALGAYGYLIWDMGNLNRNILTLDQNLSDLQQDLDRAAKAERTTQVIREQTDALTGVFNQVKSWAAALEDIRDRLPQGVQLQSVTEVPPQASSSTTAAASTTATPPADGAAAVPPPPRSVITIRGYASSVESIGEFLLLLRSSPYLDPASTVLVGAEMVSNPAQVETAQAGGAPQEPQEGSSYTVVNPEALEAAAAQVGQLPQLLEYTITTTYTSKPAEELIQALDRSSATGLVVRLEAIRNIRAAAEGAPAAAEPVPEGSDGNVQQEAP
ncbi:MAG: PilN domain-containing protein [Cyanophyceae cyanobacterium]